MDNDINREINIEQVEFGIDIDNIEYSIEINPRDTFAIELNEQGPQGARGYTGNGIASIEKTATVGLVDTYTVTYTDGDTYTFDITNGNGIASIALTSTSGLTDTYTITFDNGNTTTFDIENGKGISSITGPVSVGNVDTYTINYNDSTTSTFTVTNGISPTATVTKVGNVATITITDKDGTTTANVYDGTGSVSDVLVNGTSVLDGDTAKVTVPTNNNQLTNGAGYITGITSGDVTTALGYTPLSNATKYGADLSYSSNTLQLLDQDGNNLGNSVTVDALPSQTGQSGKFLTTDGTDASWGSVSIPTVNDATLTINQGGTLKGTFTANASSNVSINLDGNQRNIGEIVASTIPLTDAGLHLLDGSLLVYGSYQAFIDYIADLYDSGDYTDIFETEANWQTAVTSYGVCGKFVYDSVNNTVRLPKITGIIEGTTDVTALGDLVEAGLPNITGSYKDGRAVLLEGNVPSGAFSGTHNESGTGAGYQEIGHLAVQFNASNSNSIYGNSTTVQPQTIKVLYYIVVATSTKTEIQVDIDEIATDLNGKADVDLTNVNNSGTSFSASWAMPSNTYIDLILGASGTQYTAPANGWVYLQKDNGAAGKYSQLRNETTMMSGWAVRYQASSNNGCYLPVHKGDKYTAIYNATGATSYFRFIYAVGSESEAN